MKKKYLFSIIIIFSLIILNSCEETVTDVDLPYIEQLVIRSIIKEGEVQRNIRIEKTLHPLETYSEAKAVIPDAQVSIFDGEVIHNFSFDGQYYINKNFIPTSGKSYKLTVEWNNKKAMSETRVPEKPVFDSVYWYKNYSNSQWEGVSYIFYAYVTPSNKTYYMGGLSDNSIYAMNYTDSIGKWNQLDSNGKVRVVLGSFYNYGQNESKFIENIYNDFTFLITAYDEPFIDYFNTRYNSNSTGSIFGMEGTNVKWNILGDGIGLFLGSSEYRKKIKY